MTWALNNFISEATSGKAKSTLFWSQDSQRSTDGLSVAIEGQ